MKAIATHRMPAGEIASRVWEVLTRARGSSVPETDEQRALVERLYGSASS